MKEILIIFTDRHLAYSPSTLNLYDSLIDFFDVSILTFEPDSDYSLQRVRYRNIKYIRRPSESYGVAKSLIKRIYNEIKLTIDSRLNRLKTPLLTKTAKAIIYEIKDFQGEIIAVDFFALWCAQQANKSAHLLSLEIIENDQYRTVCDVSKILSVIIQSTVRYEYLFKGQKLNYFIVQNAPRKIDIPINFSDRNRYNLVYCGSAMPSFGIFTCLDFLVDFPEYRLTVKGAIPPSVKNIIYECYPELIISNRLRLDETYLEERELNEYLKIFYIGFVFYDHFRFNFINTFNYKTAPSGKLFQYYNAGIPVICNNLDGLSSVMVMNAGYAISALSSFQIKKAIEIIEKNYLQIAKNAKQASLQYDFTSNIQPFVNFLRKR